MRSRGQKAMLNTITSLALEAVVIICGLILPRLVLGRFGSAYNGLTSSISQFLSCAVLLRSGIGGATRAALYKPLKDKDYNAVNAIMSATNRFMKKIGLILAVLIIGFACIYPIFVIDEFSWFFSFSLFIIIGIDTFLSSFFGITNYILLQADQKIYIPALIHILTYTLNTIIAVILIKSGFGIHVVKFGSACVFALYPIILTIYVKIHYKIDFSVAPNNTAIGQRWDAFFHQVAAFVMNNTDTIVLTIFSTITEVSVYSVYNMIFLAIKKLLKSFTDGLEAAFGNMIAAGEKSNLRTNFNLVESLIFDISSFVCVCCAMLILQFIGIYTNGIVDANYQRPLFALLMIIAQFFNAVRQPYQLIVQAAGHYKQTKKGAIIEPILNISISVLMVIKFGLVGVAIGTVVAILFRTIQYSFYVSKNILNGVIRSMLKNTALVVVEFFIVWAIYSFVSLPEPSSYLSWTINALFVAVITGVIVVGLSFVFKHDQMTCAWKKIISILKKEHSV